LKSRQGYQVVTATRKQGDCDLLVKNNGHLTKLIKKYERLQRVGKEEGFNGVIVWALPFNIDAEITDIENAFNKVCQHECVKFNLHVFLTGYSLQNDEYFSINAR
jgi:hypothetical protein